MTTEDGHRFPTCARCGEAIPDGSVAMIGGDSYHHDEFGSAPTCYERATWERNPRGDTTH